MRLTFQVATVAALALTLPAVAQDGPGRREIARSPDFAQSRPPHRETTGRGSSDTAPVIRRPIEDAAEPPPLVENGWDFGRPETIPGFGPWQIPQ